MNADVGAQDSEVCEHDMLFSIFPTQGHTKGGPGVPVRWHKIYDTRHSWHLLLKDILNDEQWD